jgi:hypothetical protein
VIVLCGLIVKLDDRGGPVEDAPTAVEDEVVMGGNERERNRHGRPELVGCQSPKLMPLQAAFDLRLATE